MTVIPRTSVLANDLAIAIAKDISTRGLKEGDRYYTTAEVSKKFEICNETASRAMKLLASKDILVRLRRRGTFIGSKAYPHKIVKRRILVLAMPAKNDEPLPAFFSLPYLLDRVMENTSVQTRIIPDGEDIEFLHELKESGSLPDGIVTGPRSLEVLQALADLDIPIVVIGILDEGFPDLPTVDIDAYLAGKLLAEHMIKRGHSHIIVQVAGESGCGHRFVDAVAEAMSSAHLLPSSLKFRAFNGSVKSAEVDITQLLRQDNPPTAILTRFEFLADSAAKAVEAAGLRLGKDVEIGWSENFWETKTNSPFVHVLATLDMDQVVSIVAKILDDQLKGKPLEERHVLIPAKLCDPAAK